MANFSVRRAERKKTTIKIALQGPAGSGKTMSALRLAFGLVGDWSKIVVIDTENGSADLYAHLGDYCVLPITDYSPENYIEAITYCEQQGFEAIICDSISPEWDYIIDAQSKTTGNSFTNWGKFTPRHNKFMQKILNSPCHFIATMRSKQDYVLVEKNGRQVPEKVGMKATQRDGVDYEFTIAFDIDIKHNAHATKDRTSMFDVNVDFVITEEIGAKIREWCETGVDVVAQKAEQLKQFHADLAACKSKEDIDALTSKYDSLLIINEAGKKVYPEDLRLKVRDKFNQINGKA